MAIAPVPADAEIVALYRANGLPAELARYHGAGDQGDALFIERCVALHNSGDIDLVDLTEQPPFAALAGHGFFKAQRLYCSAIPQLKTDVVGLMRCCRILIDMGGQDGMAHGPNAAFREWCLGNPADAARVITDARNGEALAGRFVTFALQATNDIAAAIDFIARYDDDRRLYGMTALSAMNFADTAAAQAAIDVLRPYIMDDTNDRACANALSAAFRILKQHNNNAIAAALVEVAAKNPGAETLHKLADIVWMDPAMLDGTALTVVLNALEEVDPKSLGTVSTIDMALGQMLGTANEGLALDFLTEVLRDGRLKMEDFDSVAHALAEGDRERLYRLIIRWFLSGSMALCHNVNDLVGLDDAFDTTAQPLGLTPVQQIFVCRKAVGFLFIKPVIACSIIVSVLRAVAKEVEQPIIDLLFDPILLSYGGDARDYLKAIKKTDRAHRVVRKALAKDKSFYDGLKAAGTIRELNPSDYQRDVVRQKFHDEMRTAHKLAQSKSVFLNLVHRSTILYGKRSRTYVRDAGGGQRAVEMELKPFGASFEMPRRDILDPVGLDYMLRVFRVEKFK